MLSLFAASAWITRATFRAWLYLFIDWTGVTPDKPQLVLVDNHDSRFDATMREEAEAAGVILLLLPANSTFALQPLDVACFGPFKKEAHRLVDVANSTGNSVNYKNRWSVIAPAWIHGLSQQNIIAGFKATGIWPFDRNPSSVRENMSRFSDVLLPRTFGEQSETKTDNSSNSSNSASSLPFSQLRTPNLLDPPGGKDAHLFDDILIIPGKDTKTKAKDGGYARIVTVPLHAQEMEEKASHAKKRKSKNKSKSKSKSKSRSKNKSSSKLKVKLGKRKRDEGSGSDGKQEAKDEANAEPEVVEPRPKRARIQTRHHSLVAEDDVWTPQQLAEHLNLKPGSVFW